MAFFSHNSDDDIILDMNLTPLIDVMLVLIIMLIITIPVQQHALTTHNGSGKKTSPTPNTTDIIITRHNTFLWNKQALNNPQEIETRLQQLAAENHNAILRIYADSFSDYESLAFVLAGAQRAGLTKIGIARLEEK